MGRFMRRSLRKLVAAAVSFILLITGSTIGSIPAYWIFPAGFSALAEEQLEEPGSQPEASLAPDDGQDAQPKEPSAPDDGQGAQPEEPSAPDDGQGAQPEETSAPDDGQGAQPEEPSAPDDGQGAQPEEPSAPDDGQGAQPEETLAPDDAQGTQTGETVMPDEALDEGAETADYHAGLIPKAASGVVIYAGPKDPQVAAGDEVIDLNAKGKKLALYALVTPDGSSQAVDWFTTNKKVASIKASGSDCVVTGLKPGKVTITARAKDGSGVYGICTVTVAGLAKAVTVSGPAELVAGASAKYSASVSPKGTTNKAVTWAIDSDAAASIDPVSGILTAKDVPASAIVSVVATAADAGGIASLPYQVTVRPKSTGMTIQTEGREAAGERIDLNTGIKALQLSVAVSPGDAGQAVTWSSSNSKVAKINANGLVTGLKPGSVTITAAAKDGSGVSDTCTVMVAGLSKSVTVSGSREVVAGATAKYAASVLPKGTTDKAVSWTVDKEDAASIDPSTGVLTAKNVGAAAVVNVTATASDAGAAVSAPYAVTVLPRSLGVVIRQYGVTIDSAVMYLSTSSKLALSAEVQPADARQGLIWTSANPKVAKIDKNGVVTGIKAGQAVIRAMAADGNAYNEVMLTVVAGKAFRIDYVGEVHTIYADKHSGQGELGYAIARNVSLGKDESGQWSLDLTDADDPANPPVTLYIDGNDEDSASICYRGANGSGHVEYALRYQGGSGRYDQTVTIALDVLETAPAGYPNDISYPESSLELKEGDTHFFDAAKIAFTGGVLDSGVMNWRRFELSDGIYRYCAVTADASGSETIKFKKAGRYVVTAVAGYGNREFRQDIQIVVKKGGESPLLLTSNLQYSVLYRDAAYNGGSLCNLGSLTVANFQLMDGERFAWSIEPIVSGPAELSLDSAVSTRDFNWINYSIGDGTGTGKSSCRVTVKVQKLDENDEYVDAGYSGSTDVAVEVKNLPGGLPTDVKLPKTSYSVKPGASLTFLYSDIKFGKGAVPSGAKVWRDYYTNGDWNGVDKKWLDSGIKCRFNEPGIYTLYAEIGVSNYYLEKKITITVADETGNPLKITCDLHYPTLYEDGDEQGTAATISAQNISSDISNGSFEWTIERLGDGSAADDPVLLTLDSDDTDEATNWVHYELTGGTGSVTYRVTMTMGDFSAETDVTVAVAASPENMPTGAKVSKDQYTIEPGDSLLFEYADIQFESGSVPHGAEAWRDYRYNYDAWESVWNDDQDDGIQFTFTEKGRYILKAVIGIGNHSYTVPIEIDVTDGQEPVLELSVTPYLTTLYSDGSDDDSLASIKAKNFEPNSEAGEEFIWSVERVDNNGGNPVTVSIDSNGEDNYAYLHYHLGSGTGSATFRVTLTAGAYSATADVPVSVVARPGVFPTGITVPKTAYQIDPGDSITFKYADITPVGTLPAGATVIKDYYRDNGPWDSVESDWQDNWVKRTFNEEGRYTLMATMQINNVYFEKQIVINVGDSDNLDPNLDLELEYDTVFREGSNYEGIGSIYNSAVLLGNEAYEWDIDRIGGTSTGSFNLEKLDDESDYLYFGFRNGGASAGTAIFRVTYTAANGLYEGSVEFTIDIRSTTEFQNFPTGVDTSAFSTPYEVQTGGTLTLDAAKLKFAGGSAPVGIKANKYLRYGMGDWDSVDMDEEDTVYRFTFNEAGTYTLNGDICLGNLWFYAATPVQIIVSDAG